MSGPQKTDSLHGEANPLVRELDTMRSIPLERQSHLLQLSTAASLTQLDVHALVVETAFAGL